MIRIKRNTGRMGSLGRLDIHINDEQVETIRQDRTVELEIPTEEAKLSVHQAGVRSNELVVKKGQVVEITTSLRWKIFYLVFIIGLFFVGLVLPDNYRLVGYIVLILMPLSVNYFVEGFELNKIYP